MYAGFAPLGGEDITISPIRLPGSPENQEKDYRRATAAALTCKGRSFLPVIDGVECEDV